MPEASEPLENKYDALVSGIESFQDIKSGFAVVILTKPLPKIRHTVFVFYSLNEAEEFQSCLHAMHSDAETELHENTGLPQQVFENWSF